MNECDTGHRTTSEMRRIAGRFMCKECFDEVFLCGSRLPITPWKDLIVHSPAVPAFAVPVEWIIRGTILVEAKDLEEAHKKVQHEIRIFPGPNKGAAIKGTKILLSEAIEA